MDAVLVQGQEDKLVKPAVALDIKQQRRAQALRENLLRRKQQKRIKLEG